MNKKELANRLSILKAGDEVYSKEKGWHTFYGFDPDNKYPIRCSENDWDTSPHCYTMRGLYQADCANDIEHNILDVRFQARTMTPQPIGSAELKAPFADARVGDMVWCSGTRKKEVIERVGPIVVTNTGCEFNLYGTTEYNYSIYWQAPTNNPPNPPERAPEPMTSEEFLLAAWDLFKLAEKVGYGYSYDNTEKHKSLYIWDMGSIISSCETARVDIAEFKRRLEEKQ